MPSRRSGTRCGGEPDLTLTRLDASERTTLAKGTRPYQGRVEMPPSTAMIWPVSKALNRANSDDPGGVAFGGAFLEEREARHGKVERSREVHGEHLVPRVVGVVVEGFPHAAPALLTNTWSCSSRSWSSAAIRWASASVETSAGKYTHSPISDSSAATQSQTSFLREEPHTLTPASTQPAARDHENRAPAPVSTPEILESRSQSWAGRLRSRG